VLDPEAHRHAERGPLLDVERLVLERVELPRLAEINDDVGSALDLDVTLLVRNGDRLWSTNLQA
jgi:hypothetical protein